ncbi:MAG TPA: hypothetical protein PL033_10590 [Candidatus Brocadiia bacterium]|nr:hypothetical protein [Candidatus Brocadiia bacterium]
MELTNVSDFKGVCTMMLVYIPDVGDGLAAGISTIDGTKIQIDCGSQQEANVAFIKGIYRISPHSFFLSHFHLDHYNGLFCHNQHMERLAIREAFYPRIPKFEQRDKFLRCVMAMNHRLMGDMSGSTVADFLSVLSSINYGPFIYRSLSKGDTVRIGGSEFHVLWPPKTVDKATTKVIAKAIEVFDAAKQEDEILQKILNRIGEKGNLDPYLSDERQTGEMPICGRRTCDLKHYTFPSMRDLPEVVRSASKSLRAAANHLSLAFHEDNLFLFMGDLESSQIKKVVKYLTAQERRHFFVLVTPHHGTHWHKNLLEIHACHSISSVGSGLFLKLRPEFKSISNISLITHLNGDIEVPLFCPRWCRWKHRRDWYGFL